MKANDLARALAGRVRGEVRFDEGSRALYATDLSIYRQVPIGVVVPRDDEDVEMVVAECRVRDVPILGRGCGTSLAGQCCNVAVVLDFSKYMNRIVEVDPDRRIARVQPGVICDELRDAAERYHLTFAPDPATHRYCTLGGMIGNNSCGVHTVMGGRTADNVESLDLLLYDGTRLRAGRTDEGVASRLARDGGRAGEIYRKLLRLRERYGDEVRRRFPNIPRLVSGYGLDHLLPEKGFHVARAIVGSESTCALVLEATVRLLPSPPARALLVIGYPDQFLAADHAPEIRSHGPIGLEAFHVHVVENMTRKGKRPSGARLLPEGKCWLLAEFGGATQDEANAKARESMHGIETDGAGCTGMRLLEDAGEQHEVWHIRESGVGASRVPHEEEAWPSWEDAAVAPEKLGAYLREYDALLRRYQYRQTLFGHFGDGCVHSRITFGLKTAAGVQKFRRFMTEGAELVVRYGGSLSGEHGDGQARGELLPLMFGAEVVEAFREFKSIWDPHWRMNPGKKIDARPLDQNLRLGPDYRPLQIATFFQFPDDEGSFAKAAERCFGVGKCRGIDGGTMCPSFHATREEMHTTRGRAHLLFEMMRGDALTSGLRDPHVKEALDLCLACKGCKGDCPVQVDMATYKAEFLAHYYRGRLRPLAAYAMGLIHVWARLASRAPALANGALRAPWLSRVLKAAAGIAPQRRLPRFASQTFQQWFARRPQREARGPRVILWPDTFNNYFRPETARAAVEVLEAAGYRVTVPQATVCCGRPLYDYGMLARAQRQLREVLDVLRDDLSAGTPVVCLEPSCASVFRDELIGLFPNDEDARRLAGQATTLPELLAQRGFAVPRLGLRAKLHGHCHQKALWGTSAQEQVLREAGIEVEVLDAGCCGLAGSFGYEKDHYDISMKIGERVLLPAVRAAAPQELIVADGFSCRSQIEHATPRRALHTAEVLYLALRRGEPLPRPSRTRRRRRTLVAAAALAGAAGYVAWRATGAAAHPRG